VEAIFVAASVEPFQNFEAEMVPVTASREAVNRILKMPRGLDLKRQTESAGSISAGSISAESIPEGIGISSFTYSILPPDYADEILSYRKPANMTETIQVLGNDLRRRGGVFSGDEQAGSFTLDPVQGRYQVSGNTLTMRFRYRGNRLTGSQTRSVGGFSFSFDRPRDLNRAVQAVRNGIEQKGGSFSGNERQGSFRASGIAGQYNVEDKVNVSISEKPFIIPNQIIEREVKNYFTGQ
jgi:hypothetical protein